MTWPEAGSAMGTHGLPSAAEARHRSQPDTHGSADTLAVGRDQGAARGARLGVPCAARGSLPTPNSEEPE